MQMIQVLLVINSLIFFLLASIHVYWALGGEWARDAAIPTNTNGEKLFNPGILVTLIVAAGLLLFILLDLVYSGLIEVEVSKRVMHYAILGVGFIFLVRAIGNFNNVGFTKRRSQSVFAKMDSQLYSPLCAFIAVVHFIAGCS